MTILVLDIGTSSVRAVLLDDDGNLTAETATPLLPDTPFPGLVEFDAIAMRDVVLELANAAIAQAGGSVAAIGIANQRASTIVWDADTGEPVGPGIGWQDLRTVGECLVHQASGLHFMPNESATKLENLLNTHDPARDKNLRFGTVDAWVAWTLSDGAVHATDTTNAAVTGLLNPDASGYSRAVLDGLNIPESVLPTIVDSIGIVGEATALPGAPPIAAILGDQQASLVGQSAVRPGQAKATFGTGGMFDLCVGPRPAIDRRGQHGTYPIVAWSHEGTLTWGTEGIMLAAGTNVEWLRDDLGLIDTAAESHDLAATVDTTDGVMFVPDLLGAGTPQWDFGARGALFGMTRGTTAAHVTRAVLEGVAHRGADLLIAAEADSGIQVESLRVDGGMSQNPTFVQALANATGRAVELSAEVEATALGAGLAAGVAIDRWSLDDLADRWSPRQVVEPTPDAIDQREQWADAVSRAGHWHGDLSALDF